MGPLLVTLLLVPRPVLSGVEEPPLAAYQGRFRIHHTRAGEDALVNAGDADKVAAGIAAACVRWVDVAGMRPPLSDDGDGGDAAIDVYLRRLADARGRTTPVDVGLAPASSAFIELDPRTAALDPDRLAAAAHEAFHAIQFAYRPPGTSRWLHEASAAWVETAAFAGVPAIARERAAHWSSVLGAPGIPLDRVDGSHEYDAQVFVEYLVARGGAGVVPAIWQALAAADDPIAAVEAADGRPIAQPIAAWGAWMIAICKNDSGSCPTGVGVALPGLGALPATRALPLDRLARAVISVPAAGCAPVQVTVEGGEGAALAVGTGAVTLGADHAQTFTGASPVTLVFGSGRLPRPDLRLAAAPVPDDGACADAGSLPAPPAPGCSCAIAGAHENNDITLYRCIALVIAAAIIRLRRR